MIIGLTGKNACGKGELAKYLQSKGFSYFSLSDIIRKILSKENKESTRENMIQKGISLRKQGGDGVLAQRFLEEIQSDKNYVVDSIRHPAEVKTLHENKEFKLIFVDADPEIRFQRTQARQRIGDPATFEEFMDVEKREAKSSNQGGQQLDVVIALADVTVKNEGSLEDLCKEVDFVLRLRANIKNI